MKAIIISQGRVIDGLGDPAEDALFAGSTVGEMVDAACMELGAQPVRLKMGEPHGISADEKVLVLAADLFATVSVLQPFLARALGMGGVQRLALRRTPSVEFTLPMQAVDVAPLTDAERAVVPSGRLAARERVATEKVLYDAFVCTGADLGATVDAATLRSLREKGTPLLVDKKELIVPTRLPILPMAGQTQAATMDFPITSSVAVQLRHWCHVLWLNQLAPGITLNLAIRQNKLGALLRVLTGFSFRRERVLQRISVIHPTARVHPTAYVEASIIGPGAVVGARASVRNSYVAKDAEIGDHATVLSSVVGQRAFVTPKTFLVWCAVYPDAVVGNFKLQVSLVGKGAHVNAWAGLIDAKFQGSVRVELDGKLHSTERSFLGSCIGHGAQVASKVLIHPGRVVPNGAVVIMRPDEVISTIPAQLAPGVPMVRDEGTLKPLASLKSGAR
ncbi:MAG: hypothetical protein AB2A00_27685 [Myxococcota bacterium]